MRDYRFVGCAILFFILTAGTAMADIFGKSSLTPDWVARFQDLSKLNAYTARQPVHLSNVAITGWDISGAKFPGARFDNTEWKDVKLERSVLTNVTVSKSKLQGVSFDRSELTDVTFEDTELRSTSFYKARLQRVRFVRCKFNGVTIDEMVDSTIDITDSKLLSSSLSDGQLIATIKGSTLKDVRLSDLLASSSLTFEKSDLKEVDMSRSKLSKLNATDSDISESFINNGAVAEANFTKTVLHFGMSESSIRSLVMDDVTLTLMALDSTRIQNVMLRNCRKVVSIGFYEAQIEQLTAERCVLNNFRVPNATVGLLHIKDSQLSGSDFEELRAKTVILERVTLKNKMDFTNAHVDQLTIKNVTKLPGLNLITTGSNVKFE